MEELDKYKSALKYAIHCFRSRAMNMTTDQLETSLDDILSGQAVCSNENTNHIKLVYYSEKEHHPELFKNK